LYGGVGVWCVLGVVALLCGVGRVFVGVIVLVVLFGVGWGFCGVSGGGFFGGWGGRLPARICGRCRGAVGFQVFGRERGLAMERVRRVGTAPVPCPGALISRGLPAPARTRRYPAAWQGSNPLRRDVVPARSRAGHVRCRPVVARPGLRISRRSNQGQGIVGTRVVAWAEARPGGGAGGDRGGAVWPRPTPVTVMPSQAARVIGTRRPNGQLQPFGVRLSVPVLADPVPRRR